MADQPCRLPLLLSYIIRANEEEEEEKGERGRERGERKGER